MDYGIYYIPKLNSVFSRFRRHYCLLLRLAGYTLSFTTSILDKLLNCISFLN